MESPSPISDSVIGVFNALQAAEEDEDEELEPVQDKLLLLLMRLFQQIP